MAPTVRSSSTYGSTVSETGPVVTLPSGWQPGDVIYIGWELTATTGTVTTPSGWTAAVAGFAASGVTNAHSGVLRRVMHPGDANTLTITVTSGRFAAAMVAIQGADQVTPEDVTPTTDDNTGVTAPSVRAPSVTPVSAGCLLITFHAVRNGTNDIVTSFTPDASEAEQADASSNTSPNALSGAAVEAASLALGAAGATGTKTATATGTNVTVLNMMGSAVAVRAAATSGGVTQAQPGRTWLRRFHHRQVQLPPPVSNDLVATAGVATSTVIAPAATVADTATAGVPTATAVAPPPVPAVTVTAGVAAVSAVATAATTADTATAGVAVSTAVAPPPAAASSIGAGVGTAGAAAATPSTAVTATAAVGTAPAAAPAPAAADTATAGVGIVGATAPGATVSTSGSVNAHAGVAAVLAAAPAAALALAAHAQAAATLAAATLPTFPGAVQNATSRPTVADPRDGTDSVSGAAHGALVAAQATSGPVVVPRGPGGVYTPFYGATYSLGPPTPPTVTEAASVQPSVSDG